MTPLLVLFLFLALAAPARANTLGGLASLGGQASVGSTASGGGGGGAFNPPAGRVNVSGPVNNVNSDNALWQAGTEQSHRGPHYCEAGGRKLAVGTYLTNETSGSTAAVKDVIVYAWDYVAGALASLTRFDTNFDNSSTHNRPFVGIDPSGYVWVFYGAEAAFGQTPDDGVYYRVSTNPCDISAFGAEQQALAGGVAIGGGLWQFSMPVWTSDGKLHMFGHVGSNQGGYARYESGSWNDVNPNFIFKSNTNNPGVPQPFALRGVPGTNKLYFAWTSSNSAGCNRGVWLIKSTDSGSNWTDVAGNNSRAVTSDITSTERQGQGCDTDISGTIYGLRDWSTGMTGIQVEPYTQAVTTGPTVVEAANGDVVVVVGYSSTIVARRYTGGSWTSSTITTKTTAGHEILRLASGSLVVVYLDFSTGHIHWKKSTDHGATWGTEQTLETLESGANNYRYIGCTLAAPAGQDERVMCAWSAQYNPASATPTKHDEIRFEEFVPEVTAPPPSIAFVAGAAGGSTNAQTVDLAGIDTTGATFGASCTSSAGSLTISDNRGGTWTEQISQGGSTEARFWTRSGGTVGTNTIVSVTNNGTKYPAAVTAFYSGVSAIGTPASGVNDSGTTVQPGSVTPGAASNLMLTCLATGTSSGTITINSSYTKRGEVSYVDGQHLTAALADLIQSAATAQNPTWSVTATSVLRATHVAAQ